MPGYELWSDAERKELNDVLDNGILMRYGFDGARNGHWKSKELEAAICSFFGSQYAQLTSSGTAALTTAMSALGIGYGDEIITPAFTFVASFEAILSVGAVPVLVDVDDTLTLNPEAVRKAITSKTKAVMPVHMCGSMADMDALQAICQEHNLFFIRRCLPEYWRLLQRKNARYHWRSRYFFFRLCKNNDLRRRRCGNDE